MKVGRLTAFIIGALALMVLVGISANADRPSMAEVDPPTGSTRPEAFEGAEFDASSDPVSVPQPKFEIPREVLLVIAALTGAGFVYFLTRQRFIIMFQRRTNSTVRSEPVPTEQEQADELAALATDLIVQLAEGDSARHAIQSAYAAVEGGFGTQDLERKPAETPLRYLDRIFGRHEQAAPALGQLTDLFQRARFSSEPVDETMRTEAIAALTEIRDHYQHFAGRSSRRRSRAGSR